MNSESKKEMNPRLILWGLMGALLLWCVWHAIGTFTSATNSRIPFAVAIMKPIIVGGVTICFLGGWLLMLKMRDWRIAREEAEEFDDEFGDEDDDEGTDDVVDSEEFPLNAK